MTNSEGWGRTARLLHWGSAGLILVLLGSGFRSGFSDDAATKAAVLAVHVPVAGLVLVLTIARILRWVKGAARPDPAAGTPAWQATVAHGVHILLYGALVVLLGSGIALSVLSGLPLALFGDAPFPELANLPPRAPHGIAGRVLAGLILLHAGAAMYHHFVLKDGTLVRMWRG